MTAEDSGKRQAADHQEGPKPKKRKPNTKKLEEKRGEQIERVMGAGLGLTRAECETIAKRVGGTLALKAAAEHSPALLAMTFADGKGGTEKLTRADFVKILGTAGAAQAIKEAGSQAGQALLAIAFADGKGGTEKLTRADFVKILGQDGAAQAVKALLDKRGALQRKSKEAVLVAATKHRGAAAAIRALAGTVVKTEEVASRATRLTSQLEEVRLDQSRTAFVGRKEIGDLTGSQVVWTMTYDEANRVIVHHPMEPDPDMDNVIPFRDPGNSRRPHPAYAEGDRCAPTVRVGEAKLQKGYAKFLKDLAKQEKDKKGAGRLAMSQKAVAEAIKKIEIAVSEELRRQVRGEPLTNPRCNVRKISANGVPPYEAMLINQHGLFLSEDLTTEDLPTFQNGKILGLYPGVRLQNDQEEEDHLATYPEAEFSRYKMTLSLNGVEFTLSPLGGANSIPFANTALDPEAPEPAYDDARINAIFMPFTVPMHDKAGQQRAEVAMAVLALNNVAPGQEIRVDYGDDYLSQFKPTFQAEALPNIKTEDDDMDIDPPSPQPPVSTSGRPIVVLHNRDEAVSRSWNAGDRFQITGDDGTPRYFQVTRNRHGGEEVYQGDFQSIMIGG